MDYEELVYHRCLNSIENIETSTRTEIYALGLMVSTFWSADERNIEVTYQSVIWLRHNTRAQWKQSVAQAWDENEAKWNPSFWHQEYAEIAPLSAEYGNPPSVAEFEMRDDWCAAQDIGVTSRDEGGRCLYNDQQLERAIVALCECTIKKLHDEKVVSAHFGNPLPFVIYDDGGSIYLESTMKANPPSADLDEIR